MRGGVVDSWARADTQRVDTHAGAVRSIPRTMTKRAATIAVTLLLLGCDDPPTPTDVPTPDAADVPASPDAADVPASPDAVAMDVVHDVVAPDVAAPDVAAPDVAAPDVAAPDVAAPDVPRDATMSASGLEALLDAREFDALFPRRVTSPCRGAFYTYAALVAAARTFPAFAAEGTAEQRRRELAAFLANIAHETTGGWPTAPDGPYAWGLCWITEGATAPDSALPAYCDASNTRYPCRPGRKYYGRGPMQLSWNYNYGQAGEALGLPLLDAPERVAQDAVVAFRTALWFWMTPQAPKPSCHAVMTGAFTPGAADLAAGRRPGFGLTVNIINGGLECGRPTPAQVTDRLGYYARFTARLGVTQGDALTCDAMRPY